MEKIYIIHENEEWTLPLKKQLEARNLPYEEWFLNEGYIDLSKEPPKGIFYNRMSASSHTRNHRFAPEHTANVLAWLETHHRVIFNNSRALQLEVSKVNQYTALQAHGIQTPRTIAVSGTAALVEAAQAFDQPFITKHNRAGKGLGIQKFDSVTALEKTVMRGDFEMPVDGITLLQDYIEAPTPSITRCEFIGGKFYYAVKVDTTDGFQLCPADVCQIDESFSPTNRSGAKFEIIKDFSHPLLANYEAFLQHNGITFAGIEFIQNKAGEVFTYDVNTNTNYNAEAEAITTLSGMRAIAQFLENALLINQQ